MNSAGVVGLIGLGSVLGARHAVDWDHIAAISDFVGAGKEKRKGFTLSLFYILGHDTVNIFVGALAIFLGHSLPKWIDGAMERVVGVSLFILGLWFLIVLFQNKDNEVMVSRWKLLFMNLHKMYHRLVSRVTGEMITNVEDMASQDIGCRAAYVIGILHGFGGETATQILLYAAAAGAGTLLLGLTAVVTFIGGLFVAQILMIALILTGYAQIANHRKIYNAVAMVTACYSVAMGLIFMAGKSNALPAITNIFGG